MPEPQRFPEFPERSLLTNSTARNRQTASVLKQPRECCRCSAFRCFHAKPLLTNSTARNRQTASVLKQPRECCRCSAFRCFHAKPLLTNSTAAGTADSVSSMPREPAASISSQPRESCCCCVIDAYYKRFYMLREPRPRECCSRSAFRCFHAKSLLTNSSARNRQPLSVQCRGNSSQCHHKNGFVNVVVAYVSQRYPLFSPAKCTAAS